MTVEEGYITIEVGIRLYFRKTGKGEKLVLIPNGMYYFDALRQFEDLCTLVCYDVRNRGRSDSIADFSRLKGIYQDVEDLEALRKTFGNKKIMLIGHSYIGLMVGLYAIKNSSNVDRVIQIGPSQPVSGKEYPGYKDQLLKETFLKIAQFQQDKSLEDPVERCKKFWSILDVIYYADQRHAGKIDFGRCDLPNERGFMKYFNAVLMPSMQTIDLKKNELEQVKTDFLIIHGTMDRSAPYKGSREWAYILPNARLLTVPNVAHIPWIEAPEIVFPAMRQFISGKWPAAAEKVESMEG